MHLIFVFLQFQKTPVYIYFFSLLLDSSFFFGSFCMLQESMMVVFLFISWIFFFCSDLTVNVCALVQVCDVHIKWFLFRNKKILKFEEKKTLQTSWFEYDLIFRDFLFLVIIVSLFWMILGSFLIASRLFDCCLAFGSFDLCGWLLNQKIKTGFKLTHFWERLFEAKFNRRLSSFYFVFFGDITETLSDLYLM